jgi:uncharacterized coiled-coil protein SlyX
LNVQVDQQIQTTESSEEQQQSGEDAKAQIANLMGKLKELTSQVGDQKTQQ